jgi:hypothetical protein
MRQMQIKVRLPDFDLSTITPLEIISRELSVELEGTFTSREIERIGALLQKFVDETKARELKTV